MYCRLPLESFVASSFQDTRRPKGNIGFSVYSVFLLHVSCRTGWSEAQPSSTSPIWGLDNGLDIDDPLNGPLVMAVYVATELKTCQNLHCIAEGGEASHAGKHGKRKALKAFLHKLRHSPAAPAAATADTIPASAAPPGMPTLLHLDWLLVACSSLCLAVL